MGEVPTEMMPNCIRIKQLSIIYEEEEPEDCTDSDTADNNNGLCNSPHHSTCNSSNEMKWLPKVHHINARNLKYPLRRPRAESLAAQRKLNFGSSGESENISKDTSCDAVCTPNSSI